MKLLVITLTCFAILLGRVNSQSSSSDSSSASASSASASSASASSASASSASAGASSSAATSSAAAASSSSSAAGGGGGGASSSSVAASGTSAAASAGNSATAGGGATSSAAAAASSAGTNTATSTAASSSSTAAATMTCLYCNSTNCASVTQTVTCPGQCWGLRYTSCSDSYYFLGCLADVQTFSWFPSTTPACASTNGDISFTVASGGDVCAYVPHCCTDSGSCNTHGSLTGTPICTAGSSMLVASIAAMLISLLPALWIHS